MTDDQLIERCLSVAVADRAKESVVWREVMTAEDREDAQQEVRVAIWQALDSFDPDRGSSRATHGIKCAKRRLIDQERRVVARNKRECRASVSELDHAVAPGPAAPDIAENRDLAQLAAGAARHLPPQMARVLNLKFGLDSREPMTHAEVAEETGLPQTKVWRLVREGLRRLRAEMRVDEILKDESEIERLEGEVADAN